MFCEGVPTFIDMTLTKLHHLFHNHRFHYGLHFVAVKATGRLLLASTELPFLKTDIMTDINQTSGKMLFSKLRVKRNDVYKVIVFLQNEISCNHVIYPFLHKRRPLHI